MIAAWAASLTDGQIEQYLEQIPGLGAVLYPHQYRLSELLDRPTIAYAPSPGAASMAADYSFTGMILGRDEPNVVTTGPSGSRISAGESRAQYDAALAEVRNHPAWVVPASLVSTASWWRALLFRNHFDDYYHQVRGVPEVAWACSRVRKGEIRAVRETYDGTFLMVPALFRSWPHCWLQANPEWYVRFALDNPGTHLALWSLAEVDAPHQPFGLFGKKGEMTRVGHAVRQALKVGDA